MGLQQNTFAYNARVMALALIAVLALNAVPPLDAGGILIWFYIFPLLIAARLLSTGKFLLFLLIAVVLAYLGFAISLDRFLAVNLGTLVFFILFSLLSKRTSGSWLFQSAILLHFFIDLPIQIFLRKFIGSISWFDALFSTLGYSLGVVVSLVVFWILSAFALSASTDVTLVTKNRLGRRPGGTQIVELAVTAALTLLLVVSISIFGKSFNRYQQNLLISEIEKTFQITFREYRAAMLARAEASFAAMSSLGYFSVEDPSEKLRTLGLTKQVFFRGEPIDLIDSTAAAEVIGGDIFHEKAVSLVDVNDVLTIASEVDPSDTVTVVELPRPSGLSQPVLILSRAAAKIVLFYASREALLSFQEREILGHNAILNTAELKRESVSEFARQKQGAWLSDKELSLAVENGLVIWEPNPTAEEIRLRSGAYAALREGAYPRWMPFGEKTLISQFVDKSIADGARGFFLEPEDYAITLNYWRFFGVYIKAITMTAAIGMALILLAFPLCRLAAEAMIKPLKDLTVVLEKWRAFRGGEFGSSTAFQLMAGRARSGVDEIFQLENSFQSLAEAMMKDEKRLTTIAANYDELLRSLPLGVLAVDENQQVRFVNDALLEILRGSDEALQKLKEKATNMVIKDRAVEEWQLLQESDLPLTLLLVVTSRLDQDSKRSGVWVIVTDMTVQKKTNAQLIQASKLATLGEMSTGMAHELNQPLNIIALAATNLRVSLQRESGEDESNIMKIDRIDAAVKRAAKIIDHMRAYGRTSGDEWGRLDVGGVIWDLCTLLRDQLVLLDIDLINRVDRESFYVEGNANQFEQVMINVINNAWDAIRELDSPSGQIVIEGVVNNGRVLIRVSDSGPGIPEFAIPHIFEPFFTTKPVGQGTGLGGSISYGIVREMHGDIWAENTAGGARITVSLPLADTAQKEGAVPEPVKGGA